MGLLLGNFRRPSLSSVRWSGLLRLSRTQQMPIFRQTGQQLAVIKNSIPERKQIKAENSFAFEMEKVDLSRQNKCTEHSFRKILLLTRFFSVDMSQLEMSDFAVDFIFFRQTL